MDTDPGVNRNGVGVAGDGGSSGQFGKRGASKSRPAGSATARPGASRGAPAAGGGSISGAPTGAAAATLASAAILRLVGP